MILVRGEIKEAIKMASRKKPIREEVEVAVVEEPVEEIVETVVESKPKKTMAKVFDCDRLNFRKEQNTASEIISVLDNTSVIEIVSTGAEWTKVKANGKTGYVMSKYIQAV